MEKVLVSGLDVIMERSLGIPTVALRGELDLAGADQLLAALATFEGDRPPVLLIDLRGVTFVDSSGLRALLAADAGARREGRELYLVRGPAVVQRVFEVALLDRQLQFVDDPAVIELGGRSADA